MEGQAAAGLQAFRRWSNDGGGKSAASDPASAAGMPPQTSGSSWTGHFNRRIGSGAKTIAKTAIGCVHLPDSLAVPSRETSSSGRPPISKDPSPRGQKGGAEPEGLAVGNQQRKPFSQKELCQVAYKMSKGVEIKDRFWRLILFKHCFIGEEAVRWLVKEGYAADAVEAVAIGNGIHDLGLLEHVTKDHKFKNAHLFYRFSLDCMSETATVDSEPKAEEGANRAAIKEQADMVFLHAAHIHKLQRRLSDVSNEVELLKFSISALIEAAGPNQRAMEAMRGEIERLQAFVAVLCFAFAVVSLLQSTGGVAAYLITVVAMAMGGVMLHSKLAAHPRPQGVQKAVEVLETRESAQDMATSTSTSPDKAAEGLASRSLTQVMSSTLSRINQPAAALAQQSDFGTGPGSGRSTELESSLMPEMEEIKASPDYPLLLRLKPDLPYQHITDSSNPRSIPINLSGSFAFETDLFEGHAMLWVVGLPSSPPGLFKGRQRRTSLAVQGRFKQQLAYDDVFTGQEFFRPLHNMPAKWMINVLLRIARKLSPSSIFGLLDAPHILTPLAAGAQSIHVTAAGSGEDPPDLDAPPHEDMQPVAPNSTEAQMTSVQRKKWFSSAKNRQERFFDTEHTYTFHFWQHLLDLSTYELDMGVAQFDIASILDGQPLQLMVKQQSTGAYLWNFEAWHENLLSATSNGSR